MSDSMSVKLIFRRIDCIENELRALYSCMTVIYAVFGLGLGQLIGGMLFTGLPIVIIAIIAFLINGYFIRNAQYRRTEARNKLNAVL